MRTGLLALCRRSIWVLLLFNRIQMSVSGVLFSFLSVVLMQSYVDMHQLAQQNTVSCFAISVNDVLEATTVAAKASVVPIDAYMIIHSSSK